MLEVGRGEVVECKPDGIISSLFFSSKASAITQSCGSDYGADLECFERGFCGNGRYKGAHMTDIEKDVYRSKVDRYVKGGMKHL